MPTDVRNLNISEGSSSNGITYEWKGRNEVLQFYTRNGSAAQGIDYINVSGSNSFTSTSRYFTFPGVATYQDNIYEGPETFTYYVTGPYSDSNNLIYNYTITDEEDKPRVSIASQTVVEGDDGYKVLRIEIKASNPAAFNYDIQVRTTGGTASASTDYRPLNENLTMQAGSNSVVTYIDIIGDQWKDPTETITLSASSLLSPTAVATITIQDNDPESISNTIDDILGEARPYVENTFMQTAAAAAASGVLGAYALYGPKLIEIGGGIGTPFTHYYDEIAQAKSVFRTYRGAFETVGEYVGFASTALSVVETVNVALNEMATSGGAGRQTSESAARLSAAMLSGLAGEFVGAGVTTALIPMLAAGGALAGAPAVLPILAGVAVGSIVSYGYGQVFDQIAIAGVDALYKANGISTQSVSASTAVVAPDGSFGNVRIGNAVGQAAWRYDVDTKQLTWLDAAKERSFNELLKFTGFDTSGAVIDGSSGAYATAQSFMGTIGSDQITGTSKNDLILGKVGDDIIYAGAGRNLVDGGEGADRIYGGDSSDILIGGDGNDSIFGGAGNDLLDGGSGADWLTDWFGDDELRGGDGEDTFSPGKGNRLIDGGEGVDNLNWSQGAGFSDEPRATGLRLNLESQIANVDFGAEKFTQRIMNVEDAYGLRYYANLLTGDAKSNKLTGGNERDEIIGKAGADRLDGGGGADKLDGGDGDDVIDGGIGDDEIIAGFGEDFIYDSGGSDTIYGGEGDDRILYDKSDVLVDGGDGLDILVLAREEPIYYVPPGADFGYLKPVDQVTVNLNNIRQVAEGSGTARGFEGVDYSRLDGPVTAIGTPGNNVFIGTAADDVFTGMGSDDIIDGGKGSDLASYRGSRDEYTVRLRVAIDQNLQFIVSDKRTDRDGIDVLTSMEKFGFTDGQITLSNIVMANFGSLIRNAGDNGKIVYAFYDGLLGRAPDMPGLQGWIAALDAGASQRELASAFLASDEGRLRAGAVDDATFVEQLYWANLHRASDIEGKAGWVNALQQGTSRSEVAIGFALSNEHLAALTNVFDAGIFVSDRDAASVARLYYGILDRSPDAGGLQRWTNAVKSGTGLGEAAASLLESPEYEVSTTGFTDAQFVGTMYSQILGRAGDAAGAQGWNSYLDQGGTRGAVIDGFTDSLEFQGRYAGRSNAAYVEQLYELVLDRSSDAGGLQGWSNTLDNHVLSRTEVARAFTGSSEFQAKYVGPTDADFVDHLYENALGRHADGGGLQSWTDILARGTSRADVAVAIAQSAEAQHHLILQVEADWALS